MPPITRRSAARRFRPVSLRGPRSCRAVSPYGSQARRLPPGRRGGNRRAGRPHERYSGRPLPAAVASIVQRLAREAAHADPRIAGHHLARDAYLYIRQSTLRQVNENGESTRRQYALRERAVALGWPTERIHIIDQDLGMSGAHSVARDGFQTLVAAVGLRKVGIVLGSKSRGWHATRSTGSNYYSSARTPRR